jgi:hypothetical protein
MLLSLGAMMKLTFAEELASFARSVDILRRGELDQVLRAAIRYLEGNFEISKMERLVERVFRGVPHLAQTLDKEDEYEPYPVRDEEGRAHGINAYAFISKRCLWVIPEDEEQTLEASTAYSELWTPEEPADLPHYLRLPGTEGDERQPRSTRTLIAIPIVSRGITTSLIYFESDSCIKSNERARRELELIANAVSRLFDLAEQNRETHKGTEEELSLLDESSRGVQNWGVNPSLFFAYPEDADEEVLAELKQQLDGLAGDGIVDVFDWREFHEGGSITDRIEEEIGEAHYFVGYLSERLENGSKSRFYDNPNVMYEAGMFQGLANDVTQRAKGWLLIRESESMAPFDIITMNLLLVPRDDAGNFKKSEFVTELANRLATLVPEIGRDSL